MECRDFAGTSRKTVDATVAICVKFLGSRTSSPKDYILLFLPWRRNHNTYPASLGSRSSISHSWECCSSSKTEWSKRLPASCEYGHSRKGRCCKLWRYQRWVKMAIDPSLWENQKIVPQSSGITPFCQQHRMTGFLKAFSDVLLCSGRDRMSDQETLSDHCAGSVHRELDRPRKSYVQTGPASIHRGGGESAASRITHEQH